jgi:hypothetical protein
MSLFQPRPLVILLRASKCNKGLTELWDGFVRVPLPCHDRYGSTWAGKDIVENFYHAKDYLGIIFPVAISTVCISFTALDSAKIGGNT